jgi:thiol-disulfide isomerase/thioredoxin
MCEREKDLSGLAPEDKLDMFKKIISDSSKHRIVLFFNPGCGACQMLKPTYDKYVNKCKISKGDIIMIAVDATSAPELFSKYNIHSYPTIYIWRKGINANINPITIVGFDEDLIEKEFSRIF